MRTGAVTRYPDPGLPPLTATFERLGLLRRLDDLHVALADPAEARTSSASDPSASDRGGLAAYIEPFAESVCDEVMGVIASADTQKAGGGVLAVYEGLSRAGKSRLGISLARALHGYGPELHGEEAALESLRRAVRADI